MDKCAPQNGWFYIQFVAYSSNLVCSDICNQPGVNNWRVYEHAYICVYDYVQATDFVWMCILLYAIHQVHIDARTTTHEIVSEWSKVSIAYIWTCIWLRLNNDFTVSVTSNWRTLLFQEWMSQHHDLCKGINTEICFGVRV